MAKFEKISSCWKSKDGKSFSGDLEPLAAHLLGSKRVLVQWNKNKDFRSTDPSEQKKPDLTITLIYDDQENHPQQSNQYQGPPQGMYGPPHDDEIPF